MIGETISHYRILDKLGEGGMGAVYKAEDLMLHRTVALKFIPEGDRKRFLAEARVAAALNHPNICTIYEIDETNSFLAMEFVDGPTLKDRMGGRPLRVKEAVGIALQVAEGLRAAHESGVVHRDIKPGNILIGPKDQVKIADFGLALFVDRTRLTQGAASGTPAYMSPEQLQGGAVDRRADIWAFGLVLHEMVTGRVPVGGAIDPLPAGLDRLVRKAIRQKPEERFQHVDDLLVDLRGMEKEGPAAGRDRQRWPYAAALLVVGIAVASGLWFRRVETKPELPVRQFTIRPPAPIAAYPDYTVSAAISPDGRYIAFVAGESVKKLWIQDLAQQHARLVEGTEEARGPFWSPGSDFVGFAAGGQLRKVSASGGSATRIAILPSRSFYGATWSLDGRSIVVGSGDPSVLYEIPAAGGTAKLVLSAEMIRLPPGQAPSGQDRRSGYIMSPHFLPAKSGRRVLAFALGYATAAIVMHDLDTGRSEIQGLGNMPFYSPTGHLVYSLEAATLDVWAKPISIDAPRASGEAFMIAGGADSATVAADGTLVYVDAASKQLAWFDRRGVKLGTVGKPSRQISYPAVSPDGRFAAVEALENSNLDLWVHDLARGARIRLTADPATDILPMWSPDGAEVAYSSYRAGNIDIFTRRADGSGAEMPIAATANNERVSDWSRDGNYILYSLLDPKNGYDLWYLQRDGKGHWTPHPYLQTGFDERSPKFSPDGRYVAYLSNESGRNEVYVRPFPDGGRKWPVSTGGASQIRWSRDGREMFFVEAGALVAVPVRMANDFSAGAATRLFSATGLTDSNTTDSDYDVSADGSKFLLPATTGERGAERMIHVFQNWFASRSGKSK